MLPYSVFSRAKSVPKTGPHRVYGTLGDAHLQRLIVSALVAGACRTRRATSHGHA
jgi:hypothetical protein